MQFELIIVLSSFNQEAAMRCGILLITVLEVFPTLASNSALLVVGGVKQLILNDYYNSEVVNSSEIFGCPEQTMFPIYKEKVFGVSLFCSEV